MQLNRQLLTAIRTTAPHRTRGSVSQTLLLLNVQPNFVSSSQVLYHAIRRGRRQPHVIFECSPERFLLVRCTNVLNRGTSTADYFRHNVLMFTPRSTPDILAQCLQAGAARGPLHGQNGAAGIGDIRPGDQSRRAQ